MFFHRRLIYCVILSMLGLAAPTQAQQVASVVHTRHTIRSKFLGEERTILVRVPGGYERSNERYPVAVMLDAHPPHNAVMASVIEESANAGRMPEMILVGIQNTNRNRDLTPTKTELQDSGGADKFLDFIEKEVLPMIETTYHTQPYRVFAGHSFGGLLVVYTMITRPSMFGGYIAASPYLQWDKKFLIARSAEALRSRKGLKHSLFVALGDEADYTSAFNDYKNLLKKSNVDGLDYEFQHWTDEGHGSIVMRAYLAGMRKVFAGWHPAGQVADFAALNAHYSRLSKRYGYAVKPPEDYVNQIGYLQLRNEKTAEAIETFQKNTELYPDSPNVYDSLAEALEKSGARSKALENYEKAFKMAEQRGEAQLARSARANYERLRSK